MPQRTSLRSEVRYLKGVGPKFAALFARAGVETIEDLLYYVPRAYTDWSRIVAIDELKLGDRVTVVARVVSSSVSRRGKRTVFVALFEDDTGAIFARWYNQPYLENVLTTGTRVVLSGEVRFDKYARRIEFTNPSFEKIEEGESTELVHAGRIVPEYSQIGDLSGRRIRKLIKSALDRFVDELVDPLPADVRKRRRLPGLVDAMHSVHFPSSLDDAAGGRGRLAFEEFFLFQILVGLRRMARTEEGPHVAFVWDDASYERFLGTLPFDLTNAQRRVVREVRADMEAPRTMHRLLQGDVGSGKTVVAAAAMHQAAVNGYQAALMAPTEVLAEQHARNLSALLEPLDLPVVLLRGGMPAAERSEALDAIGSGEARAVVGTHALIQEGTTFGRLGLAIVDEQHRFGVVQRAGLREKGGAPDVLVMTATPIPRTLALTAYGDLDVSVLDEMPPGRKPVVTAVRDESARERVYRFLSEEMAEGRQVFIVYPLVEESEKIELAAATEMYETLRTKVFPDANVGLVHGRMAPEEKESTMRRFEDGDIDLLVSTTVVEVGVDVPNASVMVIEHAERFGLAQLHQLRGRVGRGTHRSYCVLMVGPAASPESRERIQVLAETNDGFVIAEKDLEFRGPGEFLGVRQHGLPRFAVADLTKDTRLLAAAREDAFAFLGEDPELASKQGTVIRQAAARRLKRTDGLLETG
ncbi:MAG: ATP-dependent DNA helicase RecG [Candidatus Eisenbacteria bacterium]|nr:ATP-dependent DNA helicase RecG [Candidatus Eisenbacteria bacterium]